MRRLLGGTYNPNAAGAPLTIYATGIRNAFDLMFDDKGQLWAPANGSSSGGNSPAGGGAPALTNIQQVEEDTLFKVVKGAYYGHPDPVRGQYVLDQGNPTSGGIPGLAFTAYPAGTDPDPKYKLPELHLRAARLARRDHRISRQRLWRRAGGKFLVAEYSAPDDIVVLSRDSSDNIVGGLRQRRHSPLPDHAVSGFTHLNGPVSLVENPRPDNLRFGTWRRTRLRCSSPPASSSNCSPAAPAWRSTRCRRQRRRGAQPRRKP